MLYGIGQSLLSSSADISFSTVILFSLDNAYCSSLLEIWLLNIKTTPTCGLYRHIHNNLTTSELKLRPAKKQYHYEAHQWGFYFLLGSMRTGKSVCCCHPEWQATPKGLCSWWRYRSRFILYLSSHHPHSSCSDNLLQSIKQALIWSYHPAKNFHFNWQGAPFITGGVSMCSLTAGERDTGKRAVQTLPRAGEQKCS